MDDKNLTYRVPASKLVEVSKIAAPYRNMPEHLMKVILKTQEIVPVFSEDVTAVIAREMNIPQTQVYSFVTFYHMLYTEHRGRYVIHMCQSAPCHIRGAEEVIKAIEDLLGIKMGETTEDNRFTLAYSPCLGVCDISPAIMINDKVYGNLTPDSVREVIKRYIREEVD